MADSNIENSTFQDLQSPNRPTEEFKEDELIEDEAKATKTG